ncbi:MAG TPA: type II toxin-antitoxin system HicB family antitoxin [Ktedonobacterales bacterium]|nr:type II toxin-antitoxin system HicB family antitoxin [Ktedonobacterales bacterium]
MSSVPHYSMVIAWSEEDQIYVVSLPEWGDLIHTHGATYAEAVARGEDLLDGLVAARPARDEDLPAPRPFAVV